MKKYIAILGLIAIFTCGTLFAMNHSRRWNDPKTELNENIDEDVCDTCYTVTPRKNYGHDEIQITNNCSYNITVSYEYWTDRWVPVKFGVDAGKESSWWPADSYRNLKCEKSKY